MTMSHSKAYSECTVIGPLIAAIIGTWMSRTFSRTMCNPFNVQSLYFHPSATLPAIVARRIPAPFQLEVRIDGRSFVGLRHGAAGRVHPARHARELRGIDPIRIVG